MSKVLSRILLVKPFLAYNVLKVIEAITNYKLITP